MTDSSGRSGAIMNAPIENLSDEKLRIYYKEINQRWVDGDLDEENVGRRVDMWNELKQRADVEQPECPECGALDWHFTGHIECQCGYAPTDQELIQAIQTAWDEIMAVGDSDE